jgi:hypothetical protein
MPQSSEYPGEITPQAPRMGVDFPLAEFEQRILAEPDVLGMVYTGSLGRGGGDRCSDVASTPVENLLARARAYVTHSHTKSTLDAYAADWKHFSAWCDEHKRRALPASPETILCYVVDLADRYTVATIDRRLSSIGYYHKQARHGLPTKDPEVERTLRGIRRAKAIAPNGKAPILTPGCAQRAPGPARPMTAQPVASPRRFLTATLRPARP